MKLKDWLKRNDARLFVEGKKVPAALVEAQKECGKVSLRDLREERVDNCIFWKTIRRKSLSTAKTLNSRRWDLLKVALAEAAKDEQLRAAITNAHAAAVFLSAKGTRCNATQIEGLPQRLIWW